MPERKEITLYLAGWQKRMLKDYLKTDLSIEKINKIKISIIDRKQWVMYRQPVLIGAHAGAWNLYLTDEQIVRVTEELGFKTKISALVVSPEMLEKGVIAFG